MGQICVRGKGQIYVRGRMVAVKGERGGRAFAAIARQQRGRGGAGKGSSCGVMVGSQGAGGGVSWMWQGGGKVEVEQREVAAR